MEKESESYKGDSGKNLKGKNGKLRKKLSTCEKKCENVKT